MEGLAIGPRTRNTELGKEAKFANMSQLCQGTQLQGQALLSFHLMAFPFSLVAGTVIWFVYVLFDDSPFSLFSIFHVSCYLPVTVLAQRMKHV